MSGRGRGRAAWAAALVVGVCGGCHRQAVPPGAGLAGLERSVFPLFVASPAPPFAAIGRLFLRAGGRACGAVYVAPHVLATSASAYVDVGREVDVGDTTVLDGTEAREITRIVEDGSGVVLLRTREPGTPLSLRAHPMLPGERLRRVAYRFHRDRRALHPRAEWDVAGGVAIVEGGLGRTFQVRTSLHPGVCGAALLDERGELAGVVHTGGGEVASVVGADTIRRALRDAGVAP